MYFARNVQFTIRDGKKQEFNTVFETKVLPVLQKQEGFEDSIVLTHGDQGIGISLWDNRNSAESYAKTAYPQVLEAMRPVIEGTPQVLLCEVPFTTLHATA
jgi:heme-degrading monooxygenase HmoA